MCKCKECGLELEDKMDGTYCLYAGKVCEGTQKRGRPLKGETAKKHVVSVRMTDDELDEFMKICDLADSSKYEVMMRALKLYKNLVVKR